MTHVDQAVQQFAPAGWSKIEHSSQNLTVFYRYATSGDSTITFSHGFSDVNKRLLLGVYRGVLATVVASATLANGAQSVHVSPAISTPAPAVLLYPGLIGATSPAVPAPVGGVARTSAALAGLLLGLGDVLAHPGGPNAQSNANWAGSSTSTHTTFTIAFDINNAPYPPTLTTPSSGATLDRGVVNRLAWTYNDPNNDTQKAYQLRYRLPSDTAWTVVGDTTSNQYRDIAAGTLPAGQIEWQVVTTDGTDLTGDWSASSIFTSRNAPAAPVITAPIDGGTAGPGTTPLAWTASEQDAYQWRRVADAGGAPAGGTIYEDSGTVVSDGTRSTVISFPTNLRTEWVQLRIRKSGLWSTWASVKQVVNYTPPAVPIVALAMDPATASLLVTITDPTPTGNQPPVAYHDVYVNDGDGEERRATSVAGSWRHWTPRSGRNYLPNVRVVAVGQTGATSEGRPAA